MDDYQIVVNKKNNSCTIHLSLNNPPPEYRKSRSGFVWAYYDGDTHTFSLHLDDTKDRNVKRVDPQIVSEELHARLNAGIARAIMEERDRLREGD